MIRRAMSLSRIPPVPLSRISAGSSSRARWLVLASVMLASCSFIPSYQRPAAPVAAEFPAAAKPPVAALKPAAELAWRDFFSDPRLKQVIELALANNRDLRVAVLNIEQARAQFRVRRADELPTLNGTASDTRQHLPNDLSPLGREITYSQYSVGLGISAYELDLFGRIRSLSAQALAQYLATEEARKSVQISLVAAVANAYLTLVADDELLALTRQTLATRDESFKLSRLRFDSGVASEVDLRQAQTLVESARASLAQQLRQRAQDENALVLLVGRSPPQALLAGQPLIDQNILAELPAGLPSEVLVERPDVRSAEQLLVAANANIGAARAAFFPRIALTSTLGTASTALSRMFTGGQLAWSFIPSLTVPIFDSGRNEANLDVAKVNREIAVAQYEKAIQTAFREVADGLAGRATLGDQLSSLRAQADAEAIRLRLSDLRYKNGVASYLDLLDSQRSLFAVQQSVIQTRLAQLQNQVTLYKALGGGWQNQPPVSLNGNRSLSSSR